MDGPMPSPSDDGLQPDFTDLRSESRDDRLLAAFGYVFWVVVPLVVLFAEARRSRFAAVHALQGLVFGGTSLAFLLVFGCLAIGLARVEPLLACVVWLGYLLPLAIGLILAYRAGVAGQTEFPVLSRATRALFRRQLARWRG